MTPALERPAAPPRLVRFVAREGGLPLGAIFGLIGVSTGLAVGLLHLDHLPFTVCGLKALLGLPCPSCGSTRALGRLFHLDLTGAAALNPLAAAGALACVPWCLADLVLLPRRRALGVEVAPGLARLLRVAAVAAVALNWLYLILAGR